MNKAITLLGTLLLLSLTSCSDEAKEVATGVKQSVTNPELMATWAEGCQDQPFFGLAASQRYYVFSGSDTTEVLEIYSDGDCKTPEVQIRFTGDLKVKGDAAQVKDGKRIRITHEKAYVVALTDNAKSVMEPLGVCGRDTWKVNEKVDVSDQSDDVDLCPIGKLPYVAETVALVEDKQLYFGAEWKKGNAIEEAVDSVDRDAPYQKVEKSFD